jgi:hypothetical protein
MFSGWYMVPLVADVYSFLLCYDPRRITLLILFPTKTKTKTKLHGLSPQTNYTDRLSDRRLSAKLVPTLADRGCRVVSATIPPQSLFSVL